MQHIYLTFIRWQTVPRRYLGHFKARLQDFRRRHFGGCRWRHIFTCSLMLLNRNCLSRCCSCSRHHCRRCLSFPTSLFAFLGRGLVRVSVLKEDLFFLKMNLLAY